MGVFPLCQLQNPKFLALTQRGLVVWVSKTIAVKVMTGLPDFCFPDFLTSGLPDFRTSVFWTSLFLIAQRRSNGGAELRVFGDDEMNFVELLQSWEHELALRQQG